VIKPLSEMAGVFVFNRIPLLELVLMNYVTKKLLSSSDGYCSWKFSNRIPFVTEAFLKAVIIKGIIMKNLLVHF